MSNVQNVALAFLMGQHNQEQADIEAASPTFTVKVTKEPKAAKPIKAKKDKSPIHVATTAGVPGLSLPEKGSLTAAQFMQAMSDAGKRQVDGKTVRQQAEVHNDQIVAIAGYIGYDNRQSFGSQDSAARTMAMRILNARPDDKGMTREEQRKADRSAQGFIAGLPAPLSSKLGDLRGRELISAEALIAHEKDAENLERSESDRELSTGLAMVERSRLAAIRADIQALGFGR